MKNISKGLLKLCLICLSFLVTTALFAEKVLIFTYSYNRPDFIEMQHKTFKKFLRDDYEFVVFNDAPATNMAAQIDHKCAELGIRCIRIPQYIHNLPYLQRWKGEDYNHPAVRNCNVVQYSLNTLGFYHDGIVALFDSDLFLVKEFSITEYMQNYDVAGLPQSKDKGGKAVEYLWIGLAFLKMNTMPNKTTINFNCGKADDVPVDAGGNSYYYLKNNPNISVGRMNLMNLPIFLCSECQNAGWCPHNTVELEANGFSPHEIKFIQAGPWNTEFMLNRIFLHYRGGTNWDHKSGDYHSGKTRIFNDFIDGILRE